MPHHKRREVAEAEMARERHDELFAHPANQLALKMLAKMKVAADPRVMPLVDFTRAYLDSLPTTDETLSLHAHQLASQRQDWYVASLFLGARGSFQADLDEAGKDHHPWHALKPWLDALHREMVTAKTGVGKMLAENLWGTVVER